MIAVRFTLAFIVIGVGAFLMGGTLPVITRIIIKEKDSIGEQFGSIYAVNTFGAVFGVLLAGYYLIPSVGLRGGIGIAAFINLAIAAGFLFYFRRSQHITAPQPPKPLPPVRGKAGMGVEQQDVSANGLSGIIKQPRIQTFLVIAFAISGFASLACQVLWTKSLALIIGSSVYAFTIMLATFLFGIAAGSMIMVALLDKIKHRQYFWLGIIQIGLAFSVLLGALLIGNLPLLFLALIKWLPHNFFGIQLVEFSVASLAMLPATLLMGAAFPLVCRIYAGHVIADLGTRIGFIYAINTIGAVTGALAAGFILIPTIGTQITFKILAGLYLLIGLVFLIHGMENRKKWGWITGGGAVAVGILTAALSPAWNPVLMNSNFPYILQNLIINPQIVDQILAGEAIYTDEDISGSVMVYRAVDGSLTLTLGGRGEGGNHPSDMNVQIEQAVLPAVLHKDPKKVLLVGLGAGITLGALLQVEGIEQVDVLEMSSGAVKANHFFAEYNHHALQDPRVNVIVDDGRHFLARTQKKYDLIIIAPSFSWVSGTSNIFTQEFYKLARGRLAPDGIFAAWFHLYSITPVDIKRFVKTVGSVFPDTSLWLSGTATELIVLGSEKPLMVDYAHIQQQLKHKKLHDEMARVSGAVPKSLIGLHLMAGQAVADYAAAAEINTDNHPLMEFSIPRHLFTFDLNENIQSLTGRRYVVSVPVSGMAVKLPSPPLGESWREGIQGESTAFPALGVKSHLTDWDVATDFINTYDYQTDALNRRSQPRLTFVKNPYTFELIPYPNRRTDPDGLKNALQPLAGGMEIKPIQFGGRPSYWAQHQRTDHIEYFVSWGCQENNTLLLGRFTGPDSEPDTAKAWSSLARGMGCDGK